MRNYLREERSRVFAEISSDSSRLVCNSNGGVALWEMPPTIACAYNPMLFIRTRYLFRVGAFVPAQSIQPNYIHIVGNKFMCDSNVNAPLYIGYYDIGNVERTAEIPTGQSSVVVPSISRIIGVATDNDSPKRAFIKASNHIYICQGTAYEDDNFICSSNGVVLYKTIDSFDTAYLDIYKGDGTLGIKLCAESIGGVTIYDASAVVRHWFAEHLSDDIADIVPDGALFVRFMVKGLGGVNSSYQFLAVNAVAQIGEDSSLLALNAKALTKMPEITLYEGYPLDYSVLSGTSPFATPLGNTSAMSVCRIKIGDTAFSTLADTDDNDITSDSSLIYLTKKMGVRVISKAVPSQPFYVRWINQLGGVDYYMFSTQQKLQATVKSSNAHTVYAPDMKNARTNTKVYSITTENKVTVGADNVNNDVFGVLSRLPFSPMIEWYNEELSKWIALGVSKFDGEENTKSNTNNIEITFNLPNINTQF